MTTAEAARPSVGAAEPGRREVLAGNYRLERRLGEGAMGVVFAARQLSIDREVVVKMLKLSAHDTELNELLSKRFRREAVATAKLGHPNTVQIIDFGQADDGRRFIVLERLYGRPLSDVMVERGPMPPAEVARLAEQVCRSLAEAHGVGVIHRDLKPDNVFLCDFPDARGVVKVMDFGVARLVPHTDSHVTRITAAGLTVGTPMYIAPEQARGLDTTPATDLYSLGVMLYEMLTGEPPFKADSGMEMAIKHIKEPPPPLRLGPDVPAEVASAWTALVAALLAKDPARRPASALEVGKRLGALATPPAPAATAPPPHPTRDAAPPPDAVAPAQTVEHLRTIGAPPRSVVALVALALLLLGVALGHLMAG